jgi:alcohol dehydrogenase
MHQDTWSTPFGSSHVEFGAGSLDRLGSLAERLDGHRILLVTDPGIRAAGHVDRAVAALRRERLEVVVFDGVEENPTTKHVEAGARCARDARADLLVGLGGGSAMDCAKGINFVVSNGGPLENYWGFNLATGPMMPSIGIPTTAGTGSESQSYALIEQETTRRKMACGDDKARFRAIILDPELTASLPRQVAAISGMDAISHAVESFVTTRRNPLSALFAREAWNLLTGNLEQALGQPDDPGARGAMLLGAYLAGMAIECSMLGAAHACANPLTSRHGITHGSAVLLMLPHVVRFNETAASALYDELAGRDGGGNEQRPLMEQLLTLRAAAGLPQRLRDCAVPRDALPALAKEAAEQWTARFNPRPVEEPDLLELYEAAW